jgi:hypothetical protein
MALTSKNQRLIAYKKLVGKSHSSSKIGDVSEPFASSVQMASFTIFGESVPQDPTNSEDPFIDNVEPVTFELEPIDGTFYQPNSEEGEETQSPATHGYKLKFPSGYDGHFAGLITQENPVLYVHSNLKVQLVPVSFGIAYSSKLFDTNGDVIEQDGQQEWILDCFSGVLFMQDVTTKTPKTLQAYVYTGKYLDEIQTSSGGATPAGSSGQIQFHNGGTPAGLGASSNLRWDTINKQLFIGGKIQADSITIRSDDPPPSLFFKSVDSPDNFASINAKIEPTESVTPYSFSEYNSLKFYSSDSVQYPTAELNSNLTISISNLGNIGPISTFEIPKNPGTDRSYLIVNRPRKSNSGDNFKWKVQGELAPAQIWNSWLSDTNIISSTPTMGLFSLSGPKSLSGQNYFLYPTLGLYNSRGDDTNSSPVRSGDVIGRIVSFGNSATAGAAPTFTWKTAAYIDFIASSNFTSNTYGSHIAFYTANNSTATEKMRIAAGGNVGIGTAPTSSDKLYVHGVIRTNSTTYTNSLIVGSNNELWVSNGVTNPVGIGTSTPNAKLDINQDNETFPALLLRNGDGESGDKRVQIAFGYQGQQTNTYRHFIHTRHKSGATEPSSGNAIDFYVSKGLATGGLTDARHVMSLESGKVGIGIVSPNELLEIYGSSPFIRLSNTTETESGILFVDQQSPATEFAKIVYDSSNNQLKIYNNIANPAIWISSNGKDINTHVSSVFTTNTIVATEINTDRFNITDFQAPTATFQKIKFYNDGTTNTPEISLNNVNGNYLLQFKCNTSCTTSLTIHPNGNVNIGNVTTDYAPQFGLGSSNSLGVSGDLVVANKTKLVSDTYLDGNVISKIKIKQGADNGAHGVRLISHNSDDYWNVSLRDGSQSGTKNNHLAFIYSGTVKGYINTDAGGSLISHGGSLNFTGQHRNRSDTIDVNIKDKYLGLIVVSDGTYASIDSNSITLNEALPKVSLSTKRNQKSAFGVVSDMEDTNAEVREYTIGNFVSVSEKTAEDTRLVINSLGEGGIWITNINGNLENGDYITTCEVPGHGMKQDDDLLHNYTVAKITCDCDFDLQSPIYMCEEFQWEGQTYRKAFVGCTYHCG